MIALNDTGTPFRAYFSYPEDGQKHPGIVLIHEVWGLTDHIKDVAEQFVKEGYVVIAPDLLSQTGITEKVDQTILAEVRNPQTRDAAQKKMREAMAPLAAPEFGKETIEKLKTCLDYLENDEHVDKNLFALGFCFGGTYAYALATKDARLIAIVPYYGYAPQNLDDVQNIACSVLAFYGEKDENLMAQIPTLDEKMQQYEKDFRYIIYPNTGHAFFNDTNPTTYVKDSADDAWAKTLAFLEEKIIKP